MTVLLLSFGSSFSGAQDSETGRPIDRERLERHVRRLASDEMEGRNAGTPGEERAAEYIAGQFKAYGLKPVGEGGTWYQPFEFRTKAARVFRTRNCAAVLEGSDAGLRGEVVVLGAHHDHVGRRGEAGEGRLEPAKPDPSDEIWNGADDNASGTAVLLEIARTLSAAPVRPRRTILFLTFSAEEYGLRGSLHYCSKPSFPIRNHAAMINLDMVGRNPETPLSVNGIGSSPAWKGFVESAAREAGLDVAPGATVTSGSDHSSFVSAEIPAVHLFSGFHSDYHRPTDHADRLDYPRLARVAQFALELLKTVADAPERPRFAGGGGRVLGIIGRDIPDEEADTLGLGRDQGGILVDSVTSGTVAERSGFRIGDLVLSFRGVVVPRVRAMTVFREAIESVPENEEVVAVVMRGKETIPLIVTWKTEK